MLSYSFINLEFFKHNFCCFVADFVLKYLIIINNMFSEICVMFHSPHLYVCYTLVILQVGLFTMPPGQHSRS